MLAPFVFADFDEYKERHWQHHRCLGVEGETKDAYLIAIRGAMLLWFFLRCLAGVEAARKSFGQTTLRTETRPQGSARNWLLRVLVVQPVLGGGLFVTALAGQSAWPRALVVGAAA